MITDAALDPYTSHGQDGPVDAGGYVERRNRGGVGQKASHARGRRRGRAQRQDGRAARRDPRRTGRRGLIHTRIPAYSAKYASAFHGRSAMRWPGSGWARATAPPTRWIRRLDEACARSRWTWTKARHGDGRRACPISTSCAGDESACRPSYQVMASTRCSRPPRGTAGSTSGCALEALTSIKRRRRWRAHVFRADAARWLHEAHDATPPRGITRCASTTPCVRNADFHSLSPHPCRVRRQVRHRPRLRRDGDRGRADDFRAKLRQFVAAGGKAAPISPCR